MKTELVFLILFLSLFHITTNVSAEGGDSIATAEWVKYGENYGTIESATDVDYWNYTALCSDTYTCAYTFTLTVDIESQVELAIWDYEMTLLYRNTTFTNPKTIVLKFKAGDYQGDDWDVEWDRDEPVIIGVLGTEFSVFPVNYTLNLDPIVTLPDNPIELSLGEKDLSFSVSAPYAFGQWFVFHSTSSEVEYTLSIIDQLDFNNYTFFLVIIYDKDTNTLAHVGWDDAWTIYWGDRDSWNLTFELTGFDEYYIFLYGNFPTDTLIEYTMRVTYAHLPDVPTVKTDVDQTETDSGSDPFIRTWVDQLDYNLPYAFLFMTSYMFYKFRKQRYVDK